MPSSGELFDRLADRYDAWFDSEEGKKIFQIEVAAFRQVLSKLRKPWLEVGAGSGRFAEALGIELGIDPSPKLLEKARKRGVEGIVGAGEALPFSEESFGAVFIIVTLCFVEDPKPLLEESHRVLIDGGKLIIGLVPKDSPWGKFYLEKGRKGHSFYSKAKFYTIKEVESLLASTGFVIERYVSALFQKPQRIKASERPLEGYRPNAGFIVIVTRKVVK